MRSKCKDHHGKMLKVYMPIGTVERRMGQLVLASFIANLCIYCKFVMEDNLVLINPSLHQALESSESNFLDKLELANNY